MGLLLFLLFIVVPIAELYVIIQVGQAIGVLPTIAILIADSFLGAALMRAQGRAAWTRFNTAVAEGRVPGREVADGAMIIFGGAFLLTPGFLTDIVGIALLIPPTRALLRGAIIRLARNRFADRGGFVFVSTPPRRPPSGPRPPAGSRPGDVEGTAREINDPDGLPRGGEQ